uniref:Serine/threonine-protein kinase RIO2 n=1 Tax=Pinguiococcus pyrenoidosus TaxID=172671 RepID=A0A7R9U5G7_9STRA
MSLDVSMMRHLSQDEFRVLTAVEMGMRNHAFVPLPLLSSLASVRSGLYKALRALMRHRLVARDVSSYEGFRLTNKGYDVLALRALSKRGVVAAMGNKLGVGKESDVYLAEAPDGSTLVVKLHRLGRQSFRAVRSKRDYLQHKTAGNWLYLSRLAAMREYAFMRALYSQNFAVPVPKDQNRHVVVMSLAPGYPMYQVRAGEMGHPERVFRSCLDIAVKLARHGLIHCDLNEFNLIVDNDLNVILIDFPQMVSVSHRNAEELFNRDVRGIAKYFRMKQRLEVTDLDLPQLPDILREVEELRARSALASATPADDPEATGDDETSAPAFLPAEAEDVADEIALDDQGGGLGLELDTPLDCGPNLEEVGLECPVRLDVKVKASGFTDEDEELLRQAIAQPPETEIMEASEVDAVYELRRGRRGGSRRHAQAKGNAGSSRAKPNSAKGRLKGRVVHREKVDKYYDDSW